MPSLSASYLTHPGRVRKMNQDSVIALSADELECRLDGLYVVADGMGGQNGGEIASRVTVETVPDVVQEILNEQTEGAGTQSLAQALREALEAANNAVYTQARANPELRGMGTTCVAALVRDGQAIIGNVGDSRAYLQRAGRLQQITDDHSLVQEHVRAGELTVEEARGSRFKNVITRAIGISDGVEPDIEIISLQAGDTLLLCSDGLTNMVPEPDIEWILSDEDVTRACKKLVDQANRNGGADNITTVVIRYGVSPAPHAHDLSTLSTLPTTPLPRSRDAVPSNGSSVLNRPPTVYRAPLSLPNIALLIIVILASVALGVLGRGLFVKEPAAEPKQFAPPPAPDYANLAYAEPVMLIDRPVRPAQLACDPAGNVYAVANDTGTVIRVSPDRSTTVFVASDAVPNLSRTNKYWATDPQGNLYVSFAVEKRIVKFNPQGARIGTIGETSLKAPQALAVDAQGNVYVIDGGRLKVFKALSPAAQRPNDPPTQQPTGASNGSR